MSEALFVAVAAAESIPDKGFACHQADGVPVVICRFRDEWFALANRCSHAASSFDEGRMRGYTLYCPRHGGAFDIRDGSATGLPAKRAIGTYPVRIVDGMVEVDVSGARE